jgi:ABC-type nitrate/sulfonate/bicarbonate transport system substrate-binding protein
MRRVAALLAAALLGAGLAACGGGGAEPGAPRGATLVLDFQPNAVHSGIYAAQANGSFEDEGVDLTIRQPSSTADSAKLLESDRADFAVMDINDFGIARQRGLDLVAIAAIVQRPLASVIARDRDEIRAPGDLAGKTIGVTGVPSAPAALTPSTSTESPSASTPSPPWPPAGWTPRPHSGTPRECSSGRWACRSASSAWTSSVLHGTPSSSW